MARLIFALLLVLAAAFGEGASLRRSLVKAVEGQSPSEIVDIMSVATARFTRHDDTAISGRTEACAGSKFKFMQRQGDGNLHYVVPADGGRLAFGSLRRKNDFASLVRGKEILTNVTFCAGCWYDVDPLLNLYEIEPAGLSNLGRLEVRKYSKKSNYQKRVLSVSTPVNETEIQPLIGPMGELYVVIKNGTASGKLEVHVLEGRGKRKYQSYQLRAPSSIPTEHMQGGAEFQLGKGNGKSVYSDLIMAQSPPYKENLEIMILGADSNYADVDYTLTSSIPTNFVEFHRNADFVASVTYRPFRLKVNCVIQCMAGNDQQHTNVVYSGTIKLGRSKRSKRDRKRGWAKKRSAGGSMLELLHGRALTQDTTVAVAGLEAGKIATFLLSVAHRVVATTGRAIACNGCTKPLRGHGDPLYPGCEYISSCPQGYHKAHPGVGKGCPYCDVNVKNRRWSSGSPH